MKESCHLWMRRIVSEGVVSCMDASHGMRRIVSEEVMLLWETGTSICRVSLLCREPWHIWRSHCIHEWTRPYMNESEESLHTWMNKACKRVILLYDEHIHLYHLWLLWHIEVAAKLLDSFLRSNKSTINLYHGTHEGVVSCMNEWYRKWWSHATMRRVYWPLSFVTALWGVTAHMKGSYHIWRGHITYKVITMRSISDMLTYSASHAVFVKGVKYISVSRVAHIKWVMVVVLQISNESSRTYERVASHVTTSRVVDVPATCWVQQVWCDSFLGDITRSYVAWLVRIC